MRKPYLLATLFIAMSFGSTSGEVQSTKSHPASRQAVIEEIKQYAGRHANSGASMDTRLVVDLYRENGELTPRQVAYIYETEFLSTRNALRKGAWESLKPQAGWVMAVILSVMLFFGDILKEWGAATVKKLGDALYERLAGRRILRLIALRRYRQAIVEKVSELRIPFRPHRPLSMRDVYVPLRLAGEAGHGRDTRIDSQRALSSYRKLMIVGPPGSGKSMLLRRILLSYAEGGLEELPDRPIPVLLELHRLNDDNSVSIEEHLAAEMSRNGFPRAGSFLKKNLEAGSIMLLMDGLDEVSTSLRPIVGQGIVDFLARYRRCRFLSTCRTAIYRGEFGSCVDMTLEVDEFNDYQIRRFLSSWQASMPEGKSVEQLMGTLSHRPRIMALARNPLLLTIIAYLYCDTSFSLPHSRSEFYERSTDILLDQWHKEHNKFKAREKRLVLQQTAIQLHGGQFGGHDRRTADFKTVLTNVREMLPELGLPPDSVGALLDEIVERSGLLLAIDGGERYAFAHLTLQEFFAAGALRESPDRILANFQEDPDAWREALRLWCGLYPDSTAVIREVEKIEPTTAFECLADVQKIDPHFADELIGRFKELLGAYGDQGGIIEAFASVASDVRPRGVDTFEFLARTLDSANSFKRLAAAEALSKTNRPQAAQLLAERVAECPDLRPSLVRLGDLAVPALAAMLDSEAWRSALDDLVLVGTPSAAAHMVPLLWHENNLMAQTAAWHLGSLLRREEIEETLRSVYVAGKEEREIWVWVWAPFNEPTTSFLPLIAGRIAFLLSKAEVEEEVELDPRLVLALTAELGSTFDLGAAGSNHLGGELKREFGVSLGIPGAAEHLSVRIDGLKGASRERFIERILLAGGADRRLPKLLLTLEDSLVNETIRRLIRGPAPRRSDWANIFKPLEYEFRKGTAFRFCLAVFAILCAVTCAEILGTEWSFEADSLESWLRIGGLIGIFVEWIYLAMFVVSDDDSGPRLIEAYLIVTILAVLAPLVVLVVVLVWLTRVILGFDKRFDWEAAGMLIAYFVLGPWIGVVFSVPLAAIGYFVTVNLSRVMSPLLVASFWLAILSLVVTGWTVGRSAHRASRNPLKGLLNSWRGGRRSTVPKVGRTSPLRIAFRLREAWGFLRSRTT